MPQIMISDNFCQKLRERGISLLSGGMQYILPEMMLEPPCHIHGAIGGILGLGAWSYIGAPGIHSHVKYGRYCSIAGEVHAGENEHPTNWLSTSTVQYGRTDWDQTHFERRLEFPVLKQTTVGNDVWIGQGAFIRTGVTIGDGAVVAARAVVVSDVPSYAIVGGIPAKVIRYRFSEQIIARLAAIKWWDYSISDISDCPFNSIEGALDYLEAKVPTLEKYRPIAVGAELCSSL